MSQYPVSLSHSLADVAKHRARSHPLSVSSLSMPDWHVQEPLSQLTRGPGNWAASYPWFQDRFLTSLPTDLRTKPFRIQLNSKTTTARVPWQGRPHTVKLRLRGAQDR